MKQDHWQLIQSLFNQAVRLDQTQRKAFISSLMHPVHVIDELEGLLASDSQQVSDILKVDVAQLSEETQFPQIKGFHIKQLIAHGGMGSVYLAFDLTLSRDVAIKILHPHLAQQEKYKQRFLQEARAAARVQHENINTIYDVVQSDNDEAFIISAYCEGVDLASQIQQCCLDVEQIIIVMRQLASALNAAHQQGIIHRDLKPENILIDAIGDVKLVDFGIAKIRDEHQTETGEVIGTPAYMSPEQFRGEAIDASSDIWSFGILLYQLLEGKTPYSYTSIAEIVYAILHEPITYHKQQSSQLEPLYEIINSCLQVEKNQRINSVEIIINLLLQAQAQLKASDYFHNLPEYHKLEREIESLPIVSIKSSRDIALLYFIFNKTHLTNKISLSSWVKKYQGHLLLEFDSKSTNAEVNCAYFGYPFANDLTIKNALSCGFEWLKKKNQPAYIYIQRHTLNDNVSAYSLDPKQLTPLNQEVLDYVIQQQSGLFVSSQIVSSLSEHFSPVNKKRSTVDCIEIEQIQSALYKPFSSALSPFTGRDTQLAVLNEHWQQVLEGDVQRVLVSGEAGIGKSRLIYEFKHPIERASEFHFVELACSPYEKHTPFYPFLNYLRQQPFAQLNTDQNGLERRSIELFIRTLNGTEFLDELLLCQLLGVPLNEQEKSSLPIGDLLNRNVRTLLKRVIMAKNVTQKSLIVIEDLHWIDSASSHLIEQLLQPSALSHTLIILSSRPEYKPSWMAQIITSNLYLSKLRQSQSETLLANLLIQTSEEQLHEMALRSGGNPLFIEELVKSVQENTSLASQTVPQTINDALLGRLNQIGSAKTLAQIASVIGRNFNLVLLKQCANTSERDFEQQFNVLIQAEIVYASSDETMWYFKHALIRDAVYQSLEKESLQQLHLSIASSLESYHVLTTSSQPSLLAMHWEKGNSIQKSAQYWQLSAQRNLSLFAISECIEECHHALELIKALSIEQQEPIELSIQVTLGPALMNRYGYADDKAGEAYARALSLCQKLSSDEQLIQIMFGRWTYLCVRAEHLKAYDLSMEMIKISLQRGVAEEMCESYMVQGINDFYRGDFVTAQTNLQLSIDHYAHDHSLQHIVTYGQNPFVAVTNFRAWNELALGNIEKAVGLAQESVALARSINHPMSLAYALSYATYVWMSVGDFKQAEALVLESIELCEEHNIILFLGLSLILHALLLFNKNEIEKGEQAMAKASEVYLPTGAKVMIPNFFAVQAEVLLKAQRVEEAEVLVDQALGILKESQENWCLTPVLALKTLVHFIKQENEQGMQRLQQLSDVLDQQKAEGLRQMFIQKGIDFSLLG